MLESRADPGAGRRVTAAHVGDMPRRRYERWPRQVTPIRAKSHAAVAGTRRPSGGSRPSASSTLAAVAGRDYLREAQGRTLTKGQILDSIVRVVEGMAQRDEDWRRLSEQLHAVLVDPDFDLDAPVDLADLMAVIAEHHEAEPPESPVEAPRRDEFPGGPQ